MNGRAWTLSLGVILTVATTCAGGDAVVPMPAAKDLPAACRAAKEKFRPLTKADVESAKADLLKSLDRLNHRLDQAGANGQAWRQYLKWNDLQAELRRPEGPNMAAVTEVYRRYTADTDGLELVWFLDVQQALHSYLATSAAVDNPQQIKSAYEQKLDALAAGLEAYAVKPTGDDALSIADAVRWLGDARQAPELVQAIQHYYVQPNLMAEVSSAIVGAGIAGPVDDTTSVRDCILGTDIHGTAHTVGQTSVEFAPDPRFAVIDTMFFGTTESSTIGYHGPVTIHSSATTKFGASKRLWIDAEGLFAYPASSNAVTQSTIHDICSNKGRQIVENMAWKRADKQKCLVEGIASRHAEQRMNRRIDAQGEERLQKANKAYEEKFRKPFSERKLFPQELCFSTTRDMLRVVALQAGNVRLGAPAAAPPVVEGADMSVCIHESMINNLTADALAGRTLHEEKVQSLAVELLGKLPDRMKGDDDGLPWAITFARKQPITATFADDGFKIALRGAAFIKGKESHPGMDVWASYKIEKTPQGFKAVRHGDIQVFPPGFVANSGQQISARHQVIRTLLEKRFEKVFPPEMVGQGLVLPGKWESVGRLTPIQLVARDGWLVVAWKRPAAEAGAAAPKTADTSAADVTVAEK